MPIEPASVFDGEARQVGMGHYFAGLALGLALIIPTAAAGEAVQRGHWLRPRGPLVRWHRYDEGQRDGMSMR